MVENWANDSMHRDAPGFWICLSIWIVLYNNQLFKVTIANYLVMYRQFWLELQFCCVVIIWLRIKSNVERINIAKLTSICAIRQYVQSCDTLQIPTGAANISLHRKQLIAFGIWNLTLAEFIRLFCIKINTRSYVVNSLGCRAAQPARRICYIDKLIKKHYQRAVCKPTWCDYFHN